MVPGVALVLEDSILNSPMPCGRLQGLLQDNQELSSRLIDIALQPSNIGTSSDDIFDAAFNDGVKISRNGSLITNTTAQRRQMVENIVDAMRQKQQSLQSEVCLSQLNASRVWRSLYH